MGLTKPRAAQIFNLDYKQSTRVVTTATVNLAGGAPSSVDGVSLSTGDRVLVSAQSTGSQNGLYYVVTVGSGSNGTWARTSDGNENGEIEAGMIVMVTEGVIYADTQWKLITDDPITINTTALTFTQNYMANSISGGTSNVVVNSNANVTISSAGTANVLTVSSTGIVVTGNIVPTANATYNLGSATNVWKSLYVANNSIYIGNVTIGATSNTLTINNANVVTADANGNTSTVGNITGGNILTSGIMSSTGNVTGGNILTGGLISATGNITGGNISATNHTGTTVSVTGTVTAVSTVGGVITGTSASVTGNVTGANILTGGLISATGNITANYFLGNVACASGIYASRIFNGTSEANIGASGGNANISIGGTSNVVVFASTGEYVTGLLSVTGNITGGNISATNHTGTTVSVTGTVTAASTVGGVITGSSSSVTGTQTAASTVGGVITGSSASVTGTVTAASTVGGVITGSSASLSGNVTGGNLNVTGNIVDTGALAIITGSNGNIDLSPNGTGNVNTGANLSVTGRVTAASVAGGVITGSSASVTGTQTAASTVGGVITGSSSSVSGNVTGGNILTGGQISATGTITSNAATNGTAFAVGNSAVSNVALGMFPTAGTSGEYAIRDYSNVATNLYLDVGMGGTANGAFQFRTSNAFRQLATINSSGISTPLAVSATGNVTGNYFIGNGSALTGVTSTSNTIVNGTSNIVVALNSNITVGVAGTAAVATFTTAGLTANSVAATNNGAGTNFKVGDDTWLGDINLADTLSVRGQQNAANAYIVFGNADATALGRAGSGPLTYGGAFSASGNVTGGNILTAGLISATGNITGGNISATTHTGTTVSVTGNVNGANIVASTALTNGNITITGANIVSTGPTLTIDPNGSGGTDGNVIITGNLSVTGNVTYINSNNVTTNDLTINMANNAATAAAANGGGIGVGPAGSEYISLTYNSTSNIWVATNGLSSQGILSATGNITGGNISATNHTGTNVSVTGTVTAASTVGGVITGSSASVTGTVTAASTVGGIITGSSASVTGTITAASTVGGVITGSSASVTGTVTAASIVGGVMTGSSLSATGNVSGGNLNVTGNIVDTGALTIITGSNGNIALAPNGTGIVTASGNISAAGNVTGGNVLTAGIVSATGNVVGSTIIASGNIVVQSRQQVKFYDTDSSNFISLRAPTALTGDYLLTLPTGYGNADQVLSTNGAGNLAWVDQSGGGGSSATSYPNSTVSPVPGSTGNFDLRFNFVQTSEEIPFETSATDAFGVNLGEVYSMMDPGGEVLEPVDLGVLT